MKRHVLIAAAIILAGAAAAQPINTTFYLDDYDVQGKRVTVIPGAVQPCTGNPANCDKVVFSATAQPVGKPEEFLLVKTDFYGNFLQASVHEHEMQLHHIITTIDSGILVAGIPNRVNSDALAILAVIKLDASLNVQWSKQIPLRYRHILPDRENIGIDRIFYPDLGEEHYFIACSSGSPIAQVSDEGVISIVRIDQAGNLVWHKSYEDPTRLPELPGPPYYGNIPYQNDGVNDLTAYWDQQLDKRLLCVAGTMHRAVTFQGTLIEDDQVFFLSVDENGNIIHDYRTHLTNHYGFGPDVVWDGTQLVAVYEQQNLPVPGTPPTFITSVVRLNPDLSLSDDHYYVPHYSNPFSYRGQSISLGISGEYVIGCWEDSKSAGRTAGLFLIDPATMAPLTSLRLHNELRDQFYHDQKHFTDEAGFHHMVPTVRRPFTSTPYEQPRLLKADPTLMETCGGYDEDIYRWPGYGFMLFDPRKEVAGYQVYDYDFGIRDISFMQDHCMDDPDPETYRPAPGGDAPTTEPAISPTLLAGTADPVHVRWNADKDGYMDIAVYNTLGQLIDHQSTTVHMGDNTYVMNSRFIPGINLVTITVDGVTTTRKIIAGR